MSHEQREKMWYILTWSVIMVFAAGAYFTGLAADMKESLTVWQKIYMGALIFSSMILYARSAYWAGRKTERERIRKLITYREIIHNDFVDDFLNSK